MERETRGWEDRERAVWKRVGTGDREEEKTHTAERAVYVYVGGEDGGKDR